MKIGAMRHVWTALGPTILASVFLFTAPVLHAQSPACQFPTTYPGDLAPRESIAAWMAARATAAGLPPELPVMASLVESALQNLNFGDADSVGFFQMRVGIWDQGPYAGYQQNPELQVKWFVDQATAVRNDALAHGGRSSIQDPDRFGKWIDQSLKPSRSNWLSYQRRLDEARQLIVVGRLLTGSWPFAGPTPNNDATNTAIAAWMATRALAAGLPGELPIMAALAESGLQNLPSDGTGTGYFHISESVESAGPYAGFPDKPELQIKWFIDHALAARVGRISLGDAFFGQDPDEYGEWIADVEKPADAVRGRYQLRLDESRMLMVAGCMTGR